MLAILRAPFARRARAEFGYAVIGLPLGIAGFVITVATLGAFGYLSVTVVGLPLIAASTLIVRRMGAVSRGLARRMLGLQVAAPAPFRPRPGFIGWIRSGLTDTAGWRARAYLLLKFPVAVAGFVVAVVCWVAGLVYLFAPLIWALGLSKVMIRTNGAANHVTVNYGSFAFDTWPRTWLLAAQGVLLVLLAPWAVRSMLTVDRWLIYGLLGPTSLTERVRDLERTRAHAVDDSAAQLRSIERDLHDGAQAQMVAVAMKLALAKEKLGGGDGAVRRQGSEPDVKRALELVVAAHHTATEAINELRDLARGIHPAVLDNGLDAALATLAARSAVPVELIVDVPDRPSPSIETIAYFCAAELLTNVAKHSGARRAVLEAVHVPGMLRVRVTDDGAGGASLDAGGGLRGLAERVRTVDGRLEVSSPKGGPTMVTVELPAHA
jgi:signal transduction histidine kinase